MPKYPTMDNMDKHRIERWTHYFVANYFDDIKSREIEDLVFEVFEKDTHLPDCAPLDIKWVIVDTLKQVKKKEC